MTNWKVGRVSFTVGSTEPPAARDAAGDAALLARVAETARGGDIEAATALADTALAGGLEHPLLFNLVAGRREAEGRFEEALRLLQRAHELGPQDLGVRQALGLVLHRLERPAEALGHFDAVLSVQPDFAPAHAARGMALDASGDAGRAKAAYDRALALQPGNLAALSGSAALASRRGAHGEARALAAQVLSAAPGYPDAIMSLAAAELAEGEPAAAEARLRELAIDPRATPQQQALAEGLLGDVLDALGRAEEAFAAYSACNRRLADLYRDRFGAGHGALAYARDLLEAVRTAPSGAWSAPAGPGHGALGHVFLVGFFDPDSPLLEEMLAGHPGVELLNRGDTLIEAIQTHARSARDLMRFARASPTELARLRQAYWDAAAGSGVQAAGKVVVDSQAVNIFKLPLIAKLFPEAKLLVARRDPRDVVLSAFRRRFAMTAASYQLLTLQGAADYYDAAMQLGERIGRDFPLEQLVVRHEDLVDDFHGVAGKVCGFLGLDGPPADAAGPAAGAAPGAGHWRWHDRPMAAVMPTLQPWLDRFGYSPG